MSKRVHLDPNLKQKSSSRLLQMRNKGAIIGLILSAVLLTTIGDSPVCEMDGGTDTLVPFDCDGKLYVFQHSPTVFSTVESDGSLESFGGSIQLSEWRRIIDVRWDGLQSGRRIDLWNKWKSG